MKFKSVKNKSFGESYVSNFELGDLVCWDEIQYRPWGKREVTHCGTLISIYEETRGGRQVKLAKIMSFGSNKFKHVLLTSLKKIKEEEN